MDTQFLPAIITTGHGLLILAGVSLIIALSALVYASRVRQQHDERLEVLREKADTLWREIDDIRVAHFNGPMSSAGGTTDALMGNAYQTEKTAYQTIWPQLWQLYDRTGQFLRTVEAGEPVGDLRLEARNAALEARQGLNRHRPFCSEKVEQLISRLVDTEIKAHLAASQYLDLLKEVSTHPSDHDRQLMQEKCDSLHEHDARALMNSLAEEIRNRMLR